MSRAQVLRNFTKRYKDSLRFARPQRQEANQFRACNAETLTTHIATLDKIITENCIDPSRIWNLDETGATPGKDANGKDNSRIYMTRAGAKDLRTGTILNTNRVTMMPMISASRDMGAPLFVFEGKRLHYCVSLNNGRSCVETYVDSLPRRSIVTMREEVGGVNSINF